MVGAHGAPRARVGQVPFVGRSAELELLDSVLDRLGDGGPAILDVTGEAGIGKSRLLAQFRERARGRGLTVLCGKATEYERHSPFGPFTDAFADLDPSVMDRFPALAELSPVLRNAGQAQGAPDRFGLYQATAAVLGGLGRDRLVVDPGRSALGGPGVAGAVGLPRAPSRAVAAAAGRLAPAPADVAGAHRRARPRPGRRIRAEDRPGTADRTRLRRRAGR